MSKQIPFEISEADSRMIMACASSRNSSHTKKLKRFAGITHDVNILDAMHYVRKQMTDPEARALYESHALARGRTARSLAMYDYLIPPTIKKIDATKYSGIAGQTIRIRAVDDFMVVAVGVLISNSRGEVIER